MKNLIKLALLIALGTTFHAEAFTIYTNGPANSTDVTINIADVSVSDSFIVSANSTLSSAVAALGVGFGDTPAFVDWAIGTTFFGSDISSGTASSLSNTFLFTNSFFGQDVYASSFSLTGVLAPGTYYFTLSNGVSVGGTRTTWDVNNGPSTAEVDAGGPFGILPTLSESFTLFGTTASVPDSGSTFGLLFLAVATLFGVSRYRSLRLA